MLRSTSTARIGLTRTVLIAAVVGGMLGMSALLRPVPAGTQKETEEKDVDELSPLVQLKRLGQAMHEFHQQHGHFPAAALVGPDGETLHSWRVALLPLLGHQELYDSYRLNEPWDSEHNKALIRKMPSVYRTAATQPGPTYTRWLAVTGPNTVFHDAIGTRIRSMKDGTANTAMLVESSSSVPWTKPEDIVIGPDGVPVSFGRSGESGFHMLLCDGSPCFVARTTPRQIVNAYMTMSGSEMIRFDEVSKHLTFHWVLR